jgi:hypothetical protein
LGVGKGADEVEGTVDGSSRGYDSFIKWFLRRRKTKKRWVFAFGVLIALILGGKGTVGKMMVKFALFFKKTDFFLKRCIFCSLTRLI